MNAVPAHQYRVTKYDPARRDAQGRYLVDEWTDFSCVGQRDGDEVLTLERYLRVEDAYVTGACAFLDEAGVGAVAVEGLESSTPDAAAGFVEGAVVAGEKLREVMRLVLRGAIWCRLTSPTCFVHFGHDFYMYVGVPSACSKAIERSRSAGLHVERMESPYLPCEADDDH